MPEVDRKGSIRVCDVNPNVASKLLEFLAEDMGFGDVTTDALVDSETFVGAHIVCKQDAVMAGIEEASTLFRMQGCSVDILVRDGDQAKAGTRIMNIEGRARALLGCERTAINVLGRMSGIASLTRRYMERAKGENRRVIVACTRKTAPGLSLFDKKAVQVGGGDTHRFRLDDMFLIKDNHIRIVGGVKEGVERAKRKASFSRKVEVEVTSLEEALQAVEAGADIVMLDNFTPKNAKAVVEELERRGLRGKVGLESSGGVNLKNVEDYAKTGVDIISVGALTHSPQNVDLSLEVDKVRGRREGGSILS